ncbi:MAG: CFI-box-CTERM domain-containing protein [Pseudobdellovibrionaceae bacterium]
MTRVVTGWTFFALLFSSAVSLAAISNVVVSSDTVSALDTSDPANIKIYAGYVGNGATSLCPSGTNDPNATCDTCANISNLCTTTQLACNEKSVHNDLRLYVEFQVDSVPASSSFLAKWGASSVTITDQAVSTPVAGSTLWIRIDWDDICNAADTASCSSTSDFNGTLDVGVSNGSSTTDFSNKVSLKVNFRGVDATLAPRHADGWSTACAADEGFCKFSMQPGDEKAFVNDVERAATGPSGGSNVKWDRLRMYYRPTQGNFCLSAATDGYADLLVKDKTVVAASLSNNKVDGLDNDVTYDFLMATVDEAGNVQYFSDPTVLNATPTRYRATPGKVVGLLDGQSCFIATAAFGSSMAPQVDLLRQFRSEVLLQFPMGRSFVKWYYENSPDWALKISQSENLRAFARVALWPVVAGVWVFFNAPVLFTLLILSLVAMLVLRMKKSGRKHA